MQGAPPASRLNCQREKPFMPLVRLWAGPADGLFRACESMFCRLLLVKKDPGDAGPKLHERRPMPQGSTRFRYLKCKRKKA